MGKPSGTEPSPPRRSRLWKWTRRLLVVTAVLFALSVVALFSARAYFRSTGQRELREETAKLDTEDPGWRFDDLMAAREKAAPPGAENSAVVVRQVRGRIPGAWTEWRKQRTKSTTDEPPPLNRLQPLEDLVPDETADATRPARDLAVTLRNYPRGYHVVAVGDAPFPESLDETQGAREVVDLLRADAVLAAQTGDPVRGLRAAHAALNTGRSIGDEPVLISSLVRFAGGNIAVEAAMRVLALTDPKQAAPELAALQNALLAEADEPVLLNGLRGERAMIDRFLERLNDGTIRADALARMAGSNPAPEGRVSLYVYRAFLPEDRRRFLRLMSILAEAAKKSPRECLRAVQQVETEVRANWDVRYRMHRLMLPAGVKVTEAALRHRASLLTAATLIACERFRLAHGRWPAGLAELPKDLLETVPLDPYDGNPIRFARLADGIAVYATGSESDADRNKKRLTNPLGGSEYGWRLYDPEHRGLPPLPKENPDVGGPNGPP